MKQRNQAASAARQIRFMVGFSVPAKPNVPRARWRMPRRKPARWIFQGRIRVMNIPRLFTLRAVVRVFLGMVVLLISIPVLAKRKDDVVVMKNGDHFTGEIKNLGEGKLSFKSSYMADSVALDWQEVSRIESKDSFIVTFSNGERIVGGIQEPPPDSVERQTLQIQLPDASRQVKHTDVIAIQQNESTFLNQLSGSIDYGMSFTSANKTLSSSLGADVRHLANTNALELSTSSQFNGQSNGASSNRFTFELLNIHKLAQRWGLAGLYTLLKSDEQNLDLRSTYGGGISHTLYQTERTSLVAIGGTLYTREKYNQQGGPGPSRNNAEALLALQASTFRFKTLDFSSHIALLPGLTDAGRVRLNLNSRVQVELVRNFIWVFTLYENHDSVPPVQAPKNDLGITTSLGWKF
jgi:putative salt-induced outer membrane protein YdiY